MVILYHQKFKVGSVKHNDNKMNKTFLIALLLLMHAVFIDAQSVEVKYFSNEQLTKEATKEKAKFSQAVIQNPNGSITMEVKNLKKDEVIRSETWKGKEPYGVWKIQRGNGIEEMDYDFPLIYSEATCIDSSLINHQDSPNEKVPKLTSADSTMMTFLMKNLHYPSFARENGIEGRVMVQFIIDESGMVENSVVMKGVQTTLDKEAVRVIRKMRFTAPTINGQPHRVCMKLPITFKLG
jgi:protein TonB